MLSTTNGAAVSWWRRRPVVAIGAAAAAAVAYWYFVDADDDDNKGDNDDVPKYSPPQFRLDKSHEYYGFVFGFDGICVAHGGDAANVGRTLAQVFWNVSDMDTAELHERFMRAADAGGGWCTYAWRISATEMRLKGAYIVGATIRGRKCYAGVGYVLCPPESAGKAMGLCECHVAVPSDSNPRSLPLPSAAS